MNIKRLAVDLAKDVFQLYGVDVNGHKVLEKRISNREKFSEFVAKLGSVAKIIKDSKRRNFGQVYAASP